MQVSTRNWWVWFSVKVKTHFYSLSFTKGQLILTGSLKIIHTDGLHDSSSLAPVPSGD